MSGFIVIKRVPLCLHDGGEFLVFVAQRKISGGYA